MKQKKMKRKRKEISWKKRYKQRAATTFVIAD